jgi:ADP-heptose:LPS heptosyltransferase
MPTFESFVERVEDLREFRRRIAPPGSRREKLARLFYVPVVMGLPRRWRTRLHPEPKMVPELEYIEGLGVRNSRHQSIRSIILFKLDHIGDLIVGMRAMRQIREGFLDAHITLVCASWNRAWAERLGWFDRVVCFDFFSPLNRNWSGTADDLNTLYDMVGGLELDSYDLAVDLRHDVDTRPCLYRIRAKYRAGFYAPAQEGWPHLDLILPLTEGVSAEGVPLKPLHADLRLQVLAGAVVSAFVAPRPHPAEALVVSHRGMGERAVAVLAIGAGDPIRCWPIERYGEVGRVLIARHGLDIVILGGLLDQADAAVLARLLPRDRVRIRLGEPLAALPQLMATAVLCVCNGSGMSHLAAALAVPTVCVLGGTTRMDVWHPAGPNVISIGGRTPCQPCGLKHACDCPWEVACLTSITTDHVVAACDRLLEAGVGSVEASESVAE